MVEGGARVIDSFFCAAGPSGNSVVDSLIVTVAPTFLGSEGVGYGQDLVEVTQRFEYKRTELVGRDTVVFMGALPPVS